MYPGYILAKTVLFLLNKRLRLKNIQAWKTYLQLIKFEYSIIECTLITLKIYNNISDKFFHLPTTISPCNQNYYSPLCCDSQEAVDDNKTNKFISGNKIFNNQVEVTGK
ncbi:hypothetical protein ACJX0J_015129, partial [Zea mays]